MVVIVIDIVTIVVIKAMIATVLILKKGGNVK